MIKKINRFYRILIKYKALIQENIIGYKYFVFPARPKAMIRNAKSYLHRFDGNQVFYDEKAILDFHREIYNANHRILAVGVGAGLSLIYNCKFKRKNPFLAIEASRDQITITKMNAELNNINRNSYKIIEGYAGSSKGVYGHFDQHINNQVNVNDFEVDVLELDCEGAEIEILENLKIQPEYIIVEMHPTIIKINYNSLMDMMALKNYQLVSSKNVIGQEITNDELASYFDSNEVLRKLKNNKSWGEILPVLLFELKSN